MIIGLGRPAHHATEIPLRDGGVYRRAACGTSTRELAEHVKDVTCFRCMRTKAYREARKRARPEAT